MSAAARVAGAAIPRRTGDAPYVAAFTFRGLVGRWRERYTNVCAACFDARAVCAHHPELPLRLLLLGHNPSDDAFQSGYLYSHRSNRMWPLLTGTYGAKAAPFEGVVPPDWPITAQDRMPLELGVGFTDLGVEPGNDAAAYTPAVLKAWREQFYASLRGHVRRVGDTLAALYRLSGRGGSGAAAGGAAAADVEATSSSSSSSSAVASGPPPKRRRRGEHSNGGATSATSALLALDETTSVAPTGGGPSRSAFFSGTRSSGSNSSSTSSAVSGVKRPRGAASSSDAGGSASVVTVVADSGAAASSSSASSSSSVAVVASWQPAPPCVTPATAERLLRAVERMVGKALASEAACRDPSVCAPRYAALTGKGQWKSLFDPPLKECDHGLVPRSVRPPGWPLPPTTDVFVLTSSSGRAAMTDEVRVGPYGELAQLVKAVPWDVPAALAADASSAPGATAAAAAAGTGAPSAAGGKGGKR